MQAQALITQLVFDHSLRIRFVGGDDNDELPINDQDADNHAEAESMEESQHEDTGDTEDSSTEAPSTSAGVSIAASSSTAASQNTDSKAKDEASCASKGKTEAKKDTKAKDTNLIGKINSLVTTDLSNIVGAQGFLDLGQCGVLFVKLDRFIILTTDIFSVGIPFTNNPFYGFFIPVTWMEVCLCLSFFTGLCVSPLRLACSVFVGIALIIILLPVPGYAASLTQDLHKNRMKMVCFERPLKCNFFFTIFPDRCQDSGCHRRYNNSPV